MKEIPMNEIPDIPRQIAVAFADTYIDMRDTVKLASDIQNYAEAYLNKNKPKWISIEIEAEEGRWYNCLGKFEGGYYNLLGSFQFNKYSGFTAYGEPFPDERVTHYQPLPQPVTVEQ